MATNTYYSPFFPDIDSVGKKGTTIAAVPSLVVDGIKTDVDNIKDQIADLEDGGFMDTTPPGTVTGLLLSSTIVNDGTQGQIVTLRATWNKVSDTDVGGYDLQIRENSGNFVLFSTSRDDTNSATQIYEWQVRPGQTFFVQVRAVDKAGNLGNWSSIATAISAKDSTPPGLVTGMVATAAFETIFLAWNNPVDTDLDYVEIYSGTSVTLANATLLATVPVKPSTVGKFTHAGLARGTSRSYWFRAVDTSGNKSNFGAATTTTTVYINVGDFTPGLSPIQTVQTLPSPSGYTGATTVFNQQDSKLYNYVNGQWIAGTASLDDNSVTSQKLVNGAVTNVKLAADSVTADKILANSITANKFVAASRPVSTIGINMRVDADGVLRWDTGTLITIANNGNQDTTPISSAQRFYPGSTMYIVWNAASRYTYFDNTTDISYITNPNFVHIATWEGGSLLTMVAGTGTIVNGDRIVTGTLSGTKVIAQSITADRMVLGTLTAAQIATDALTARVIATGNPDSILPDSGFRDASVWDINGAGGVTLLEFGGGNPFPYQRGIRVDGSSLTRVGKYFPIEPGATYKISTTYYAVPGFSGWINPVIHMPGYMYFSLETGNPAAAAQQTITVANPSGEVRTREFTFTASTDATLNQQWQIAFFGNYSGQFQLAMKIVRVSDSTLIKDGAITTDKITVNTLNGDRILTNTLDAAKIRADSVLAGTITVSSTGQTLATVASTANTANGTANTANGTANTALGLANNPAPQINANTTQIDPGRILISGGTTLASWRFGGDNTKIEGGNIAASTISANKLTIGNRGLSFIGLNFEWNPTNNVIYWTEGYIYYTDEAGTPTSQYIQPGNISGNPYSYLFFYWNRGENFLRGTQAQIDSNQSVFIGAWWGGSNLNITYGGTIINGDRITTNTITANKLNVTSLSAITANIGLLRTATTGKRLEISNNLISGFYDNNFPSFTLGGD